MMTLGRTYGSTVPGGDSIKSSAQALKGASAAPAASASRVFRKRGGVCRGMAAPWVKRVDWLKSRSGAYGESVLSFCFDGSSVFAHLSGIGLLQDSHGALLAPIRQGGDAVHHIGFEVQIQPIVGRGACDTHNQTGVFAAFVVGQNFDPVPAATVVRTTVAQNGIGGGPGGAQCGIGELAVACADVRFCHGIERDFTGLQVG